jgi:hypothetical protein
VKIISHRGNINGPVPSLENKPVYIDDAIRAGYDVEVDLWYVSGRYLLGHDTPDYEVRLQWLLNRNQDLWVHCKNLQASQQLVNRDIRYFCHTSDPYTIVSPKHLWVHELDLALDTTCVIPLMTMEDLDSFDFTNKIYGVCTDYPNHIRNFSGGVRA